MSTINLLYQNEYAINDYIKIAIPTVGEILQDEDMYYSIVTVITSMPFDLMVELDDMGVDYASINEWELFLLMFPFIQSQDTHLIFKDLDLSRFEPYITEQNGNVVLLDEETGIVIDRAIHGQIAATLRKIHHLKKNYRKPGNDEAKKYLLERARIKRKRNANKNDVSQLESLIIALVNTEQFKYDYEGVKNLSIYQFNESVQQIIWKIDYEHRMQGVYAGTVSTKEMSQDEFNWLQHK